MPDNSTPANPFSGMGNPFDVMQKMWGMAGMPTPGNLASLVRAPQQMPSMLAPTIDIGELDKRIADLRVKGLHEEADRALAEFRRAYPDYRIGEEQLRRVQRQ